MSVQLIEIKEIIKKKFCIVVGKSIVKENQIDNLINGAGSVSTVSAKRIQRGKKCAEAQPPSRDLIPAGFKTVKYLKAEQASF